MATGGRISQCLAAACVGLIVLTAAVTANGATPPQVTVISDSIMTAVQWNAKPMAILGQGVNLQMEVGVCRRVAGVSCPYEGGEVPTLVDLVPQLGSSIAKTVIVEVGYNDPADVFPAEVDDALQVLFRAGVTRVLWANMHEAEGQYPAMNQELLAAAERYPQLTVLDWNAYAGGHPEWFQTDGLHLVESGGEGMATLLHNALAQLVLTAAPPMPLFPAPAPADPPLVLPTTALPAARAGRPYAVRLTATGGTAPYHWQVTSGPLPRGLHLLADGRLMGTPRHAARVALAFRATDALGQAATRHASLVIAAGARAHSATSR